jgi:hypothetical protein
VPYGNKEFVILFLQTRNAMNGKALMDTVSSTNPEQNR